MCADSVGAWGLAEERLCLFFVHGDGAVALEGVDSHTVLVGLQGHLRFLLVPRPTDD